MKLRRRRASVDDQLPQLVEVIARAFCGGATLVEAVRVAAREVGPPLGHLVSDDALLDGTAATPAGETALSMFAATIGLARELGGASAQVFDELAAALRTKAGVRREGQALATQGRMSAWIIGAMPLVFSLFTALLDPRALGRAFSHPIAGLCLLLGLACQAAGILWIRRITSWLR